MGQCNKCDHRVGIQNVRYEKFTNTEPNDPWLEPYKKKMAEQIANGEELDDQNAKLYEAL